MPLWKKIVAGGAAGAVASAIANPSDLMKVRLQTDGMAKDEAGKLLPKRYTGMANCFMTILYIYHFWLNYRLNSILW